MGMDKKAQSTVEFSLLTICLIAVLVVGVKFVTRSVQGNMRDSADYIGEQYDPINNDSKEITQVLNNTTESLVDGAGGVFWLVRPLTILTIPFSYLYERIQDVHSYSGLLIPQGGPYPESIQKGEIHLDPLP